MYLHSIFLALKNEFFTFSGGSKSFLIVFYEKSIMQLFSADAIVFSKIGPDPFISQSSPDHSPELIFHKMKSRDQTSVLLSVAIIYK